MVEAKADPLREGQVTNVACALSLVKKHSRRSTTAYAVLRCCSGLGRAEMSVTVSLLLGSSILVKGDTLVGRPCNPKWN
jgi:hypothetical protein